MGSSKCLTSVILLGYDLHNQGEVLAKEIHTRCNFGCVKLSLTRGRTDLKTGVLRLGFFEGGVERVDG